MALCPECDTDLDLDEDVLEEGEIITCPECGSDFEIITASPLSLIPWMSTTTTTTTNGRRGKTRTVTLRWA